LQVLLAEASDSNIESAMRQLRHAALQELQAEGVAEARTETLYAVDLRYRGQSYTLEVPWQGGGASGMSFHERHESEYGHRMDLPVELVNVRVLVRSPPPTVMLPEWKPARDCISDDPIQVYGHETVVPVRFRDALRMGETLRGPTVIREAVATTFIDPGWIGEIDRCGNLLLIKQ
jgi:N-methylhydantoinase A